MLDARCNNMGCKHSTQAPTEDDFLVVHEPPSVVLCSILPPKKTGSTYEFFLPKGSWDTETSVGDLQQGMKLIPYQDEEGSGKLGCSILQNDEEPIALLSIAGSMKSRKALICSFISSKEGQSQCGVHDGKPLFKWAEVMKKRESNQFIMKTMADDAHYVTEYFGPVMASGRKNMAVKRNGIVCASLQGKWNCRVGPGIDPATIVCFVVSIDKLKDCENKAIEQNSYTSNYDIRNVYY